MSTHTMSETSEDIARLRRMLFGGFLVVTIKSPNGTEVKFRFTPVLNADKTWDGRAWWLNRGREYVGVIKRAGTALELVTTSRSTNDPIIHKATRLLLAGLGGNLHPDYTLTASDRCGRCSRVLTDPDDIRAGMHDPCPGS